MSNNKLSLGPILAYNESCTSVNPNTGHPYGSQMDFFKINTVGSFSDPHIRSSGNGIRAIIAVEARWKPLKPHAHPVTKE